ncbi:hypothetical protein [Actinophytocola gossypii]|uniref:Uncharacterized protein n=1 Tax=Actinophytocola gossypii TaxID=2812003 RepID=A0ABT2J4A9_9PSEU|nr:hypothetical protein [Actinophytocola gossypii]MCT2582702.1 hypothetical protein [Actinophytocola gossypii]
MAADRRKGQRSHRIDPTWPDVEHPVTEIAADRQGALSPYGDVTFPLPADEVGYVHPETEINK